MQANKHTSKLVKVTGRNVLIGESVLDRLLMLFRECLKLDKNNELKTVELFSFSNFFM